MDDFLRIGCTGGSGLGDEFGGVVGVSMYLMVDMMVMHRGGGDDGLGRYFSGGMRMST